MAKLEGVKIFDMVNGEITKVKYNGEIYEKVDECDVEFTKHVAFRKVAGNDSESDELASKVSELDERVTALESDKKPERKLKVGDKVRTLARGMFGDVKADEVGKVTRADDGSKFSVRVTTEDDYDYFRPQDLELITEKPWKKGDKVRHKHTGRVVTVYAYQPEKRTYGKGAGWSFTGVAKGFTYIDEHDFEYWDFIEDYELITESEYVPVEEKAEYELAVSPPFQVGEYVRVIEGKHGHEGKVVKIIADDFCEAYPYDTELLDGLEGDCYSAEHLEKVTDEEVKLAKLGRKPGEYKKGDIVQVIDVMNSAYLEVGQITYVTGPDETDEPKVRSNDGGERYARVELVAPVESRVDL